MPNGYYHCGWTHEYRDMGVRVVGDRGDLVWLWLCPICDEVVAQEPLRLPSDMPRDDAAGDASAEA